jgi:peptidoglycan LD-endopeptidase LytH
MPRLRSAVTALVAVTGMLIVAQHFMVPVEAQASSPVLPRQARTPVAPLLLPVEGVAASSLRDSFGAPRVGHRHAAIDILAPRGTPALAACDGVITKLRAGGTGGLTITIAHGTTSYYYAHLDRYAPLIWEGMPVRRGDVIGYVGTTGNAPRNTPHLHFAIEERGVATDPYPILTARTATRN